MHFDSVTGWVRGVRHCPSPNFNLRPQGDAVSLLVIHNISLPPGQFGTGKVQAFFQNRLDPNEHPYFEEIRHLTVSAHFLIERDGAITQFVSCHDRAWHAGVSCFDGREACNDFSLGIELEGTDTEPYTDAQYTALAGLTRLLPRPSRRSPRNASRATAISPRNARPIPARLSTGRATAPD